MFVGLMASPVTAGNRIPWAIPGGATCFLLDGRGSKVKVTKAQAQENRARIVETAATLFRERGYHGVGVADLMAAAGFTHGGFYKHFGPRPI